MQRQHSAEYFLRAKVPGHQAIIRRLTLRHQAIARVTPRQSRRLLTVFVFSYLLVAAFL
jgi:hypothetical protein